METNIIPDIPSPSLDDAKQSVIATTAIQTPRSTSPASLTRLSTPSDATHSLALPPTALPPTAIPITIHTSPTLAPIQRFAKVNSAAGLTDPFTLITNEESYNIPASSITLSHLFTSNCTRCNQKLSKGAILVEAGDFAAVACWEPPTCTAKMEASDDDLSFPDLAERPIMQGFARQSADWRRRTMRGRDYWHLTLMARDPERGAVRGAVRAVLEAGIYWAGEQRMPIWLEAGNQRARDVYAAFGFTELGVTWHGGCEGVGVPIWMMVKEPS